MRWLGGSPQGGQDQGNSIAALAASLGIDPAVLAAVNPQQQAPSRIETLGQLGGSILRANDGRGQVLARAFGDFGEQQGARGQQNPLGNLGQILELQSMIDARKGATQAQERQQAWMQSILDDPEASPQLKQAVQYAGAAGFNNAANAITAAMKPGEVPSYEKAAIDPEGMALFAVGWDGVSKPTEKQAADARALLAAEQAKTGPATPAASDAPPGIDPKAWQRYQIERMKAINKRALGIEEGMAGVNDRYNRLTGLLGDLRTAQQYIGPGSTASRAALWAKVATKNATPAEKAAYAAIQAAEAGQIEAALRARISETGAILLPGSQTEREGRQLLATIPGVGATPEQLDAFEQKLTAWHQRVLALGQQVGKYRGDPLRLEQVLSGITPDEATVVEEKMGSDGRMYRIYSDGTMEPI